MALDYFQIRDYQKAADMYHKIIELEPKNAAIYSNLGTTYGYLGNTEAAIKNFDKALELKEKEILTV